MLLSNVLHPMLVMNKSLMHNTNIKHTPYILCLSLLVFVNRLFWQPNTALFSSTPERGHQRPVQLHTSSPG